MMPRLITESRTAAVLCNRFLVETGLLSLYPSSTLTDAYDQFKSNLVQKRRNALTTDGQRLFNKTKSIPNMIAKPADVAKDLKNLIHWLASDAHSVDLARAPSNPTQHCFCTCLYSYLCQGYPLPTSGRKGLCVWREASSAEHGNHDGSVPPAGRGVSKTGKLCKSSSAYLFAHPEEKRHLHHNAIVVDHEYKLVATLAAGNIGLPP